jgi:arylformamidase
VVHVDVDAQGLIAPGAFGSGDLDQERLLLHTGTHPNPNIFNADFAALHPDAVDLLHEAGTVLVGIDTPSVDPASSTTLKAHQRFKAHGMTILEGICLKEVPEGLYELIAAPLKLVGFDGSPVRAVLRTLPV